MHPADCDPARITKANKDLANKLDFKDIKFPVKIRDIRKIEKKRILFALVFLCKKTSNLYIKKMLSRETC